MATRRQLSEKLVTEVVIASGRKCCLCYFLKKKRKVRKGQIAHLNKRNDDDRIENLVWLCLDHHDEFDSRTSQSKGLTPSEVKIYRDRLIKKLRVEEDPDPASTKRVVAEVIAEIDASTLHPWRHAWKFPLWFTVNESEFFAYTAPGADGVCAIERVDLPDGQTAIACIQLPGNPGKSITNAAEYIFQQVCERFELSKDQVVWLENYDFLNPAEWREVSFSADSDDLKIDPNWTSMTPERWSALGLSPKKRLSVTRSGALGSKLRKHFPWPVVRSALGFD